MASPPWEMLRQLTAARIGLSRAGPGIATADHLGFRAAHALARDAVAASLDLAALAAAVAALGLRPLLIESGCADRATYLARPDLGRTLAPESAAQLRAAADAPDIAFLLAGGLSARAVQCHAVPLLTLVVPALLAAGWRVGPACLVGFGRVALGDAVGAALGARLVVVLIGERPGLSAPDSMGAYLTWSPLIGRSDAERNCLSNIRPAGMDFSEAAHRLLWLVREAFARQLTGVTLKDGSDRPPLPDVADVPALR
jgi:ethanolamine ammonia-lyase small subunit